jgi:hypothetical protein
VKAATDEELTAVVGGSKTILIREHFSKQEGEMQAGQEFS